MSWSFEHRQLCADSQSPFYACDRSIGLLVAHLARSKFQLAELEWRSLSARREKIEITSLTERS